MNLKKIVQNAAFKDFRNIGLLLALTTLLFHLTDLDIAVQKFFYSPAQGWQLEREPFWDFIYRFGIFPGYMLVVASLLLIAASSWSEKFIKFRKAAIIMVFTLIIGPGLLVNVTFKDHWGRPRPREIIEFGGTERFVPVCLRGSSAIDCKSFPCGHCSMGFYMAIPYLFLRKSRKGLAYSFLAVGICYGFIIGLARMMAGGHFLSDVIWSGGIVWVTALAGYYLFRFDKPLEISTLDNMQRIKNARVTTAIVGFILPVITVGLVLATPYTSTQTFSVDNRELKQAAVVRADLRSAIVDIADGQSFQADYALHAFGFPNSKVRYKWALADNIGTYTIQYMGWFTEIKNNISLKLPMYQKRLYMINVESGRIKCSVSENAAADFRMYIGKGNIYLKGNDNIALVGDASKIANQTKLKLNVFSARPQNWNGTVLEFEIKDGKLQIE